MGQMSQEQKRVYLINELKKQMPQYRSMAVPQEADEQKRLLRSLFNVRPPKAASETFLAVQNDYLTKENVERGVCDSAVLPTVPLCDKISLWQGDITTLRIGAIVNAANRALLGCFVPCHSCIDNAIPFQITHRFTS